MGMAASQARLLTITARLADNELRSQTINNAKMRLATQSSQASENYINALNNATKTFTNYDLEGESVSQALTYNALTAYSSYNTQYGLVNSSGQLLVSESEAAMFANCGNNLSNYLKAHGLEYKTTYFEELGGFTNAAYPEPYNNMSIENLEDWYSKYTSFENSVEVENFEIAISKYENTDAMLSSVGEDVLSAYLISDSNNPKLYYENNNYGLTYTNNSLESILNEFKNAFWGSNQNDYETTDTNKYNLDFLKEQNYIDGTILETLKNRVSKFSMQKENSTDLTSKVKVTETLEPFEIIENKNAQGVIESKTYKFDKETPISITVQNGKIISYDFTELRNEETSTKTDNNNNVIATYTFGDLSENYKTSDGTYSKLCYNRTEESNGTSTETDRTYLEFKNGKLESYQFISEVSDLKSTLNDIVDTIICQVLAHANYENFVRDIKDDETYGMIRPASANGKTVAEIYGDYLLAKNGFLPAIFDSSAISTVEADMEVGTLIQMYAGDGVTELTKVDYDGNEYNDIRPVNIKNIQDLEFILQYAKQKGLTFAEEFNTVIKEYIMDKIIEVNGTPKFAWVDENDPSNTGNADAKAQWYTNMFNRMQHGYKQIEDGLASSKEWIEYALESGIVTMEQVDKYFNWQSLDYKTCTRITEVTDDAAVARAEAEYNRAMNDIKAKDNIYDLQLKNIDTEHTSLQTEYSVLEKVIQKNIERTFKFDQSA